LIDGSEDLFERSFRYRIAVKTASATPPILHITATVISGFNLKDSQHGFGFDLAQIKRRAFSICKSPPM